MSNTWKTTVHDIVQVDQSTFDFPKSTTWLNTTYQDQEPSKPLPVTYSPKSDSGLLNQNSPDGFPWRFYGPIHGQWFTNQGEVIPALENMEKYKESAINSLTREITADYTNAYWIDPNGKVFQVRGSTVTTEDMNKDFNSHSDWIAANIDMLVNEYGFKPVEKSTGLFNVPITVNDLINAGWVRVGDAFGTDWGITLKDLNHIPSSVDSLLAQFAPEGAIITVATPNNYGANYTFEWPVKSIQNTVNQIKNRREYYQKPVMAKQASIEDVGGVKVFVDPTWEQAKILLSKAKYVELRGIVDPWTGGSLYLWDSNSLTHEQVIRALGLGIDPYADDEQADYLSVISDEAGLNWMFSQQQKVRKQLSKKKKTAGNYSSTYTDEQGNEFFNEQHQNDEDQIPYTNFDQRGIDFGMHDSPENTDSGIGWPQDENRYTVYLDQIENPADRNFPPGLMNYDVEIYYNSAPMSDGIEQMNPN